MLKHEIISGKKFKKFLKRGHTGSIVNENSMRNIEKNIAHLVHF